jgi:cellulose synthase/poly-beta-1,6-N-acetylglucosamine synthase-like glycosyltransferase
MIVPTLSRNTTDFLAALDTWRANNPLEIILVTTDANLQWLEALVHHHVKKNGNIQIHAVPKAGKRRQIAFGLQHVKGDFVVLADADVFWGPQLLPHLLACFEDKTVGAVGSRARVQSSASSTQSVWHFLADFRFAQRFCHVAATNLVDGGISCLSGRTAAYHARLLQDGDFIEAFTGDDWRGKHRLDSGDDTFITRWIQTRGWKAVLQTYPAADIVTSAFESPKFLGQRIRWSRNAIRSFLRYLCDWRLMSR